MGPNRSGILRADPNGAVGQGKALGSVTRASGWPAVKRQRAGFARLDSNRPFRLDRIRRGPEAKPGKLAPCKLSKAELAGSCNAGLWPAGFGSNASAPTDLFGCVVYGEEPEAKPEKLAPCELSTVELALDLAGWKPALLDGGRLCACKAGLWLGGFGSTGKGPNTGAGFARLCRPEARGTGFGGKLRDSRPAVGLER